MAGLGGKRPGAGRPRAPYPTRQLSARVPVWVWEHYAAVAAEESGSVSERAADILERAARRRGARPPAAE